MAGFLPVQPCLERPSADWVYVGNDSVFHICNHPYWFEEWAPHSITLKVACDQHAPEFFQSQAIGSVELPTKLLAQENQGDPKTGLLHLRDVLYVPGIPCNVLGRAPLLNHFTVLEVPSARTSLKVIRETLDARDYIRATMTRINRGNLWRVALRDTPIGPVLAPSRAAMITGLRAMVVTPVQHPVITHPYSYYGYNPPQAPSAYYNQPQLVGYRSQAQPSAYYNPQQLLNYRNQQQSLGHQNQQQSLGYQNQHQPSHDQDEQQPSDHETEQQPPASHNQQQTHGHE